MSSFIPLADADFVTWLNDHAVRWAQNHAAIGLSTSQSAAYSSQADSTTKAWQSYNNAKDALTAARDAWIASKTDARNLSAADCRIIKTFAENSANPSVVYTSAGIPAPKTPVSGVAPGQPEAIKATLDTSNGNLKLRWKCNNPGTVSGTVYVVSRRNGSTGAWQPLGITSVRSFTDTTLSASATVQYQVTAQRSGISGNPSLPVTVTFGHTAGGETFVQSVRMAA